MGGFRATHEMLGMKSVSKRTGDHEPFYEDKSKEALRLLDELMPAGLFKTHVSEGALFLWLQLQIPITSLELYERLKSHGLLVRYMDYCGWGDGLRISVGTDEQIDRCLACLKSAM